VVRPVAIFSHYGQCGVLDFGGRFRRVALLVTRKVFGGGLLRFPDCFFGVFMAHIVLPARPVILTILCLSVREIVVFTRAVILQPAIRENFATSSGTLRQTMIADS